MEVQGAGTIMRMWRKEVLKQIWRLYWQRIEMEKREERQQAKCDHYLHTKQMRKKRVIYNAFLKYFSWFQRAKSNIEILFKNMDVWEKRNYMQKWRDQGDLKTNQIKQKSQNQHTLDFDQLNINLGKVVKSHTSA